MIFPEYKRAIVRIEVRSGSNRVSSGTGFFVSKGRILTAYHVVADRNAGALYKGTIWACFVNGLSIEKVAEFDSSVSDPILDFALLICRDAPDIVPIPLRDPQHTRGTWPWSTYGFPKISDQTIRHGKTHSGAVRDWSIRYGKQEASAIELYCLDAAMEGGQPVSGLSGAPCIVRGHAVGLLRAAIKDNEEKTVAGTLYATPINEIASRFNQHVRLKEFLPFEDYAAELMNSCERGTLRSMAEIMQAEYLHDYDSDLLRQAVASAMLYRGPELSARALKGAKFFLSRATIELLIDITASSWIQEDAISAMRALLNANSHANALALNTSHSRTGKWYVSRAVARFDQWGWKCFSVIAETADDIIKAVREKIQEIYGCTDAELDEELEQLHQGNLDELFIFVHDTAHSGDHVKQLRRAFNQNHLHIIWLCGEGPFGNLRRAVELIDCIEPEINVEDERRAIKSADRATRQVNLYFAAEV